jgi:hypothetical protein
MTSVETFRADPVAGYVTWPAPFPQRRSGPLSADEAAAGGYRWAVALVGTFGEYGTHHLLTCQSRQVAERRAAVWRGWRSDVQVTVCELVDGRWLPR